MKRPISLSIFFPAYNEERNIVATVEQAEKAAKKLTDTYEIIIVDDGSKDSTPQLADELALKNRHVRVVHHNPNQGYGAAVWSGIKAARYEYVFFTDADLQFDLQELEDLVKYVPEYKVVLGYRAKRQDPFMRLLNAKGWNFLNRFLFGLRVKDIDCAFKLFARETVAHLPIKSRGAMMSAELLIRLQRKGLVFKEVPVTHLPRKYGSATGAKPAVIIRAFKEMIAMYRGDLGQANDKFATTLQAVKFSAIGVVNTGIDFFTYIGLTRLVPVFTENISVAKAISFFLGSIFSFFANRRFTFKKAGSVEPSELGRFYAVVALGLIINVSSLYLFTQIFHVYDLIGFLFATIITLAWNFILSKLWVFKNTAEKKPDLVVQG